ncbi:MAG: hypothetical protein CMA64_00570 [Euryarchaeota archaeon]|jgi:hypothetical protein|nr:hypothetical protein [Euryarchaeota archaeon]
MEWDIEDYRKKPPAPSYLEWTPLYWQSYCGWMVLLLFIIPWIMGFSFSPFGLLTNVIIIDYIWYRQAIVRGEY